MDAFEGGPDEELRGVGHHVTALADALRTAAALVTVGQGLSGEVLDPEPTLRMVAARAFLTDEWGSSVDSRLSEACSVLGVAAEYARALNDAGIGAWLAGVWTSWDTTRASSLAPQLFDPRISVGESRQAGVPAIPLDVVAVTSAWLARQTGDGTPRLLDLSAGTGATASALVTRLQAEGRHAADDLLAGLRLVEADRGRLDVACVIVARALERSSAHLPAEVLRRVRESAVEASATEWSATTDEQSDLVFGTTPLGPGDDAGARPGSAESDLSASYARVLCDRVSVGGAGTLVALSSLVTAPVGKAADARDRLLERFGTVEFLTYDEGPVALLGSADGVSRVIVRVLAEGIGQVTTTPIMRCSREGRQTALLDPPRTTLHQTPPFGRSTFVPRIGSDVERRLVDAVIVQSTSRWKSFRVQLTHGDHRGDEDAFSVGATARDAFSIALREPRVNFGDKPTANARFGVRPTEPEGADLAIAILMSRTAFWWWTASGDGLHVRKEHLTEPLSWLRLMAPEERDLAARAGAAWRAVAVAQASHGPGGEAPGLDPAEPSRLTRELDLILLAHLGATEEGARELLARRSLFDV